MANHVVLYSNGIADFRWSHLVDAESGKSISIPVRKEYLADILSSLTVYGNVSIPKPPSFQPSDQQRKCLDFDAENVMASLASRLSGAEVDVTTPTNQFSGTLIGLQTEQRAAENRFYNVQLWLVGTSDGIHRVPFPEIISFRFTDSTIQSELDWALACNVNRMKPTSTVVELELAAEQTCEATVQYTVPCAAWKISYRLLIEDESDTIQFMGFAIVDNNTDSDWENFHVSVVTGEPITFSSDLDEIRLPRRTHVKLVSDKATGAVEVAPLEAFGLLASTASPEEPQQSKARKRSVRQEQVVSRQTRTADTQLATVDDVGDFSVFHSPDPVTIRANGSAMIPTFTATLDGSRRVLYFNPDKHASRPYQAIQFRNSCEFPLGRGACTVYENHSYAGSCVLPPTKPEAEALLIHALDTGVRVEIEEKPLKTRLYSVKVSKGVAVESSHKTKVIKYRFKNLHHRKVRILLDHPRLGGDKDLSQFELAGEDKTGTLEFQATGNCFRSTFELEARETATLTVTEGSRDKNLVHLISHREPTGTHHVDWLNDQFIKLDHERLNDPNLQQILSAHQEHRDKLDEIDRLKQQQERLTKRQERLRKNIRVGSDDPHTVRWRQQLGEGEDKLIGLEEQIETLTSQADQLAERVYDLTKDLVLEWNNDA